MTLGYKVGVCLRGDVVVASPCAIGYSLITHAAGKYQVFSHPKRGRSMRDFLGGVTYIVTVLGMMPYNSSPMQQH